MTNNKYVYKATIYVYSIIIMNKSKIKNDRKSINLYMIVEKVVNSYRKMMLEGSDDELFDNLNDLTERFELYKKTCPKN